MKILLSDKISMVIGVVGGMLVSLFGGFDVAFKVLCVLMLLDIVSGLLKAIWDKNVDSRVMFKGLIKKTFIFIIICVGHLCDLVIKVEVSVRDMCILFYIAEEALSILENSGTFINYPKVVKDVLKQLYDKSGGKGNE